MNSGGFSTCYYELLGIHRSASAADVRSAYRKLALKWHPDRWARDSKAACEAKQRFQTIQEAYSVLSDDGKRAMYDDVGFFDPFEEEDDDDDDPGFTDFMKEMVKIMDSVKSEKPSTLEDLQRMLAEIVAGSDDCGGTNNREAQQRGPSEAPPKRARASTPSPSPRTGKNYGL